MDVQFGYPNLVYRQSGEAEEKSTELLAVCRYNHDAVQMAKQQLEVDARRDWHASWYMVVNTYDGTATMVYHKKKEESDGT